MDVSHILCIKLKKYNNFRRDSIALEIYNNGVTFEILEKAKQAPPGWHKISGDLAIDVKINFTRKVRWVLDGYKTPDPVGSTYADVVSRESVIITFTYVELNDPDSFAADVRNAYLWASFPQKNYIIYGPGFGLESVGKVTLVNRALYGGKSAGRNLRYQFSSCMMHLDFVA